MKQYWLSVLLIPVLWSSCSTGTADRFQIKGTISGLGNDSVVLLINHMDSMGKRLAPDTVFTIANNNTFELSGEIQDTKNAFVSLGGSRSPKNFSLFLEPGDITISGNIDSTDEIKVSGTASNDEHSELNTKQMAIYTAARLLQTKLRSDSSMDESARQDIIGRINHLQDSAIQGQVAFVREHPGSMVSALRLYVLQDRIPLQQVDSLYNKLTTAVKQNGFAIIVANRLAIKKTTAPGNMAPDFTMNDINGKPVSLSEYHGKYVLLDFWASWCVPCRAENPYLVKAYNQYKDKGFTIISVSLDDKKALWEAAIEKDQLTWTHISDLSAFDNKVAKLYGVQPIPDNFLIDPSGKIIAKELRGKQLEDKLATLFQ